MKQGKLRTKKKERKIIENGLKMIYRNRIGPHPNAKRIVGHSLYSKKPIVVTNHGKSRAAVFGDKQITKMIEQGNKM